MSIYDFNVKGTKNEDVSLSDYKGKVLLIVNTATDCGFTPQYAGLAKLYDKYVDKGFEILDFPTNQFLNQAPGTNEQLADFAKNTYGTKFRTFAKIEVNGKNASPLFVWLKDNVVDNTRKSDSKGFKKLFHSLKNYIVGNNIKWNFTKFLVDREGNVVKRYAPNIEPVSFEADIKRLVEAIRPWYLWYGVIYPVS